MTLNFGKLLREVVEKALVDVDDASEELVDLVELVVADVDDVVSFCVVLVDLLVLVLLNVVVVVDGSILSHLSMRTSSNDTLILRRSTLPNLNENNV